ncbi:MAG TPA: response regulator [Gemmatimonadaceae bacterium]|jgi:two-component system cell cycle response regulator|nr:response regulator [Gemmatimonadaceae bacterium]
MSLSDTSRKSPDATRKRTLVLLVDDNVQQREMYEVALERDFDIVTAGRGADAIVLARERQPDVIILDVRMPGMGGVEACERLKSDPATERIPVIMLTGADDERVRSECAAAGAFAVLGKPCTHDSLVQAIRAACAKGE